MIYAWCKWDEVYINLHPISSPIPLLYIDRKSLAAMHDCLSYLIPYLSFEWIVWSEQ
jgi:hypothetical protein